MKKNPLVVINIPNGKAMAQVAKQLGYSTEVVERFKTLDLDHSPSYINEKMPKDETYWGSNMAWVPEHRYKHVEYTDFIKEHKLKPKQYTEKEIQEWVNEQITAVKGTFMQHFPEKSFRHYMHKVRI